MIRTVKALLLMGLLVTTSQSFSLNIEDMQFSSHAAKIAWLREHLDHPNLFNTGVALEYALALIDPYQQAIQELHEDLDESQDKVVYQPQSQQEATTIIESFHYFNVAMIRMMQEAACLQGGGNAAIGAIMIAVGGIYNLFPQAIRKKAIEKTIAWAKKYGDAKWKPSADLDTKPQSQWYNLRRDAMSDYIDHLTS